MPMIALNGWKHASLDNKLFTSYQKLFIWVFLGLGIHLQCIFYPFLLIIKICVNVGKHLLMLLICVLFVGFSTIHSDPFS